MKKNKILYAYGAVDKNQKLQLKPFDLNKLTVKSRIVKRRRI